MVLNGRCPLGSAEHFSQLPLPNIFCQFVCLLKCLICIMQEMGKVRKSPRRTPIADTSTFTWLYSVLRNVCIFSLVLVLLGRKLAGLKSWILALIFSYCTLKYVFSIIRQVDKHFNTEITKIIEDNPMFYEGPFKSHLKTLFANLLDEC